MSTETERDIEKTLKAYVDQRKDQAGEPLAMPGYTRALLRREVAQMAKKPGLGSQTFWKSRILRFAFGFALVVLAIVEFSLRPQSTNTQMRLASEGTSPVTQFSLPPSADKSKIATPPPPAAAAPAPAFADQLAGSPLGSTTTARRLATAATPAPVPASALSAAADFAANPQGGRRFGGANDNASAPAAGAPSPPQPAITLARQKDAPIVPFTDEEKRDKASEQMRVPSVAAASPTPAGSLGKAESSTSARTETKSQAGNPAGAVAATANGVIRGAGGGIGGGSIPAVQATANAPVSSPPSTSDSNLAFRSDATLGIAPSGTETPVPPSVLWKPAYPPPPETVELKKFTASALAEGLAVQDFTQLPSPIEAGAPAAASRALKANDARPNSQKSKVLQSFRMEQSGEQLRVTDADGSIYTGGISRRDTPSMARLDRAKTPLPGDQLASKLETEKPVYFFRVEGTNQTLNVIVRFSGDLTPTDAVGDRQTFGATAVSPGPSSASNSLSRAQLRGRARIGDGPDVPINAFPVGK